MAKKNKPSPSPETAAVSEPLVPAAAPPGEAPPVDATLAESVEALGPGTGGADQAEPSPEQAASPIAAGEGTDGIPAAAGPDAIVETPPGQTVAVEVPPAEPTAIEVPVAATPVTEEAAPSQPPPPDIQSLFKDLAAHPAPGRPMGYLASRPDTRLSADQAILQFRIYQSLARQGVTLRKQGDVYGWLLNQVAAAMR